MKIFLATSICSSALECAIMFYGPFIPLIFVTFYIGYFILKRIKKSYTPDQSGINIIPIMVLSNLISIFTIIVLQPPEFIRIALMVMCNIAGALSYLYLKKD